MVDRRRADVPPAGTQHMHKHKHEVSISVPRKGLCCGCKEPENPTPERDQTDQR